MAALGSFSLWPCFLSSSNAYSKYRLLIVAYILLIQWDGSDAYFANWGDIGRAQEPTCVDIPKNMSLCSNIQYERMRLPNLLAHDTLTEVAHQSASWVPLLNVGCHPDTQLFLCSLFTPVCLERPIYPCRSLCVSVQTACEKRMTAYGYHWPDMLKCENFPEDNDMCLKALHSEGAVEGNHQTASASECEVCRPVPTYENILDNFCRSDFVLRARVRGIRDNKIIVRKARVYKPGEGSAEPLPGLSRTESSHRAHTSVDPSVVRAQRRALRKPRLTIPAEAVACCTEAVSDTSVKRYLVMGKNTSEGPVPTFVLPWVRQKSIRDAVRVFNGLDCSDPSLFTPDTHSGVILNTGRGRSGRRQRGKAGGRRRGERRRVRPESGDLAEEQADGRANSGGRRRGGGRRGDGRRDRRNRQQKKAAEKKKVAEEESASEVQEGEVRRGKTRNGGRRRDRSREQRLGRKEKERRKEFIRRKIEQSRMDSSVVESISDNSGANVV